MEVVPRYGSPQVVFGQLLPSGEFDVALFSWSPNSPDYLWKGTFGAGGDQNWTGYRQRLVTSALDQAERILDAARQTAALNRADMQMAKDVPASPLYSSRAGLRSAPICGTLPLLRSTRSWARRTGGSSASSAAAVSFLAVSGAGGASAQTPKRGGIVVVGVPAGTEPACFNLLIEDCGIQVGFVRQVLEGAFEVGPDLSYRLDLVSKVTLTKKPFTLTYHIRPEARWSDGVEVMARDFVFTWRTDSKLKLGNFPPAIRSVVPLDAKTVRVDFRSRYAGWRDLFGVVLPRHALAGEDPRTIWQDRIDNPKTGDAIGSGPFLLVPVDRGRQFTLVRNPRYWGPHKAYLDRLVFRFLPPPFPGSGIEAMRGGTVDALMGVTHDQEITAFCREGGVQCVTDFSTSWDHIAFRNGPGGDDALKHRSVRQAIAYGIDRDALVRQLYPDLRGLHRCRASSSCLASASTSRT